LVKLGYAPKQMTRLLVVAINIPAIYLASEKYDVISLFLVADLVCATSVFPVFLGLQTTDIGILKAPTELGAFLGCVSGVLTVLINGIVNDAEGGIFEYFWLKNEGICALCGSKTMISFIITPVVSAIMTYVFTFADIALRGERARQPIFTLAWDVKEDAKSALESSEDENEWEDIKDTEAAADADVVVDEEAVIEDVEGKEMIMPNDTLTSVDIYT
jgi:SSS family solute:Na+ symporter